MKNRFISSQPDLLAPMLGSNPFQRRLIQEFAFVFFAPKLKYLLPILTRVYLSPLIYKTYVPNFPCIHTPRISVQMFPPPSPCTYVSPSFVHNGSLDGPCIHLINFLAVHIFSYIDIQQKVFIFGKQSPPHTEFQMVDLRD